jgi:hypothetical protein
MSKLQCKSCGTEIHRSWVILYWPSRIRCRKCAARHTISYAAPIGTAYVFSLLALTFAIKGYADRFEIRDGNTFSMGPLQAALELGAPLIALSVVGPLYAWVLGRYFQLRINGP